MTRFGRNLPLLLALAAGVHLVGPLGTARADLEVTLHEVGTDSSTDVILSGGDSALKR